MTEATDKLLICDLTQSYSPHGGGGISTFLREKRRYILENTGHRLLQIVPGAEDKVVENGRHIWVEIGADQVRGSPNYRFILRTSAVREVLERFRPDLIESLCPWILPWTAINHRRAFPRTALVAGYHTDFPNAHLHRVGAQLFGETIASGLRRIGVGYAGLTYREFDRIYVLGEDMQDTLRSYGLDHVDTLDLGVDTDLFHPARRDPEFRRRIGLDGSGPLLVYAGRIDNEKRADMLLAMMRELPDEFGAALLMLGDGKLADQIREEGAGLRITLPGFVAERDKLAVALASSDIYVSAMADETFGISVVEAQACGLPVVGVRSGAMPARVPQGTGLLGPANDAAEMARNVMAVEHMGAQAMGQTARRLVEKRYRWDQTFAALIGEIYPRALEAAAERVAAKARKRTWLLPA
jgi:glycosyltransferase involved in cell wall biosynthesis